MFQRSVGFVGSLLMLSPFGCEADYSTVMVKDQHRLKPIVVTSLGSQKGLRTPKSSSKLFIILWENGVKKTSLLIVLSALPSAWLRTTRSGGRFNT